MATPVAKDISAPERTELPEQEHTTIHPNDGDAEKTTNSIIVKYLLEEEPISRELSRLRQLVHFSYGKLT